MKFTNVPIPKLMEKLDKDKRGYPIPVMVFRDSTGQPHFTINKEHIRQYVILKNRCGICGNKLFRGRWFVGGPQSAFDPHGCYIDPPMHEECAEYALKVCPWLAVQSYSKRIEGGTLPSERKHEAGLLIDNIMNPNRPDPFVAVMAVGQTYSYDPLTQGVMYIKPHRPYRNIMFYSKGERLTDDEAIKLLASQGINLVSLEKEKK